MCTHKTRLYVYRETEMLYFSPFNRLLTITVFFIRRYLTVFFLLPKMSQDILFMFERSVVKK
jgi:hypothetical protein